MRDGPAGRDAGLERRVFVESEGLPLFVAEYLAALARRRDRSTASLTDELRTLLGARLGGCRRRGAPGARSGRRRSGARSTSTRCARRADAATRRRSRRSRSWSACGLVREVRDAEPTYDFSHYKLRELVYDEIALARRRLLHRRIAAAMPRRPPALVVAQQLRLAGDHAGAAEQYRLAAEHAASLLAHADALEHLEAALALGNPDAAALHERIGDLRTLLGDYAGALASYEAATAVQASPTRWRRSSTRLGGVHAAARRVGARRGALHSRTRSGTCGRRPVCGPASSPTSASRCTTRADRPGGRAGAARRSSLAESAGDRRAEAQAHNMLGVHRPKHAATWTRRSSELERSLDLAQRARRRPGRSRGAQQPRARRA